MQSKKVSVDLQVDLFLSSRLLSTDMDIADRAIQVGRAREGQSFVLKE
jgi:hypothetical protein